MRSIYFKLILSAILLVGFYEARAISVYRSPLSDDMTCELVLYDDMRYSIVVTNLFFIRQVECEYAFNDDGIVECAISEGEYACVNDTIFLMDNKWNCTLCFSQYDNNRVVCMKGFPCMMHRMFEKEGDSYTDTGHLSYRHSAYPIVQDIPCVMPGEYWSKDGYSVCIRTDFSWSIKVDEFVLFEGHWKRNESGIELRDEERKCSLYVWSVCKDVIKLNGISDEWIDPYFEDRGKVLDR